MYRSILLTIIITIFAGCGKPEVPQRPTWFTSPPKDFNNFYAVASAISESKAKNLAIASLREQLNNNLDASFRTKTHKLSLNQNKITQITQINEHRCKTISMRSAKVEKLVDFEGDKLILISISKKKLFELISNIGDTKMKKAKTDYINIQDKTAIERYINAKTTMQEYYELASNAQFKQNLISTYSANDEFIFLNTLETEYQKLKSNISVYILSDGNSRVFIKSIKEAILDQGLVISKTPKSKDSIKLLITSTSEYDDEYTFKRSKTLIKFSTYNMNREKIKFIQHTFIGKSKKNYKEAKTQSAIHLKAKMNKLGLFNFIGITADKR